MDLGLFLGTPVMTDLVQTNMLERCFHDGLFPQLLFRGECALRMWPGGVGQTQIFTETGIIPADAEPLPPGTDPMSVTYPLEQWEATLNRWGSTIDTNMQASAVALASLFLRNMKELGKMAGASINKIVRAALVNAGEAGWTVVDGTQTSATLRVKRLNGFTRARSDAAGASNVRYATVSAANPLACFYNNAGTLTAVNVVGFTPDLAGDETGPGTLSLAGVITAANRSYFFAGDATATIRAGGGYRTDDIGPTNTLGVVDIRTMVAAMRQDEVPVHAEGYYHVHVNPTALSALRSDPQMQLLFTACPDAYEFKEASLGIFEGCIWIQNTQCPLKMNVRPNDGTTFSIKDPIAPELYSNGNATTGTALHRTVFTGQGGIFEYWKDPDDLLSEAGILGKVGAFKVTNNGAQVDADRVRLIMVPAPTRLQDTVWMSYAYEGAFPVRTDGLTGWPSRFKRVRSLVSS